MQTLQVRDCLDPSARRVRVDERYRDLAEADVEGMRAFAVFAENGGFAGLVTDRQATLFPSRRFGDLLTRRQGEALRPNDDAVRALHRMRVAVQAHLPVIEPDGTYLGVISVQSVLAELVRRAEIYRQEREVLVEQLEAERESLRAQYLHLAYYDSLTGLPNRQLFQERLNQAIGQSSHRGTEFSLLFLDLNRFKDVNDTLGHSFGDRLLKVVAERFSKLVRQTDMVARLGGDEFTFILHDTGDVDTVNATARRIFDELAEPIALDGIQSYVSASIGVSRYPADGVTAEALVMNADAAMYRAKEDGIGACHFYSPKLHDRMLNRLDISNALHRALEREEFSLVWQPQVSLTTGVIVGAEVLLRWNRDGMKAVSPAEFVPIAEETGMIGAIGDWVLHETCRYASRLEALQLACDFRIAVNFSPMQLRWHKEKSVLRTIHEHGLDCRRFKIELTENSLFLNKEGMAEFVRELGAAGVAISVDDFGTGYSNLSSLKHLPVSELKIDRSFIHDMQASHSDKQLVLAMIGMAQMLGLRVVAEGVEHPWQVAVLKDFGCDIGQGYLFSRPVAFDELLRRLEAPPFDVRAMLSAPYPPSGPDGAGRGGMSADAGTVAAG
ncbi:putative bifunctional diguanylate cyclase/phosphodiesterase [Cupriavidus plantarum]|uniref:putative bifunctional diguanylate cyclase/phosphodiesterase n=1 Tax=Cupriavidus plantarum TaxID=942865 RepID=UPI00339D9E41